MKVVMWLMILTAITLTGCGSGEEKKEVKTELPIFSIAVSEYPSWSTFVVAKKSGLINGTAEGEPSALEKKWGVRLKLEIKDYDPCLTMYGSGVVDACCMTNIDALNPSLSRSTTVIMPTSTSVGGDKIIGVGLTQNNPSKEEIAAWLKGKKTYGLSKSVSEFVFHRGLQKMNLNPKEYEFINLEPAAAATAIQSGSKDVQSVCVWNPYALQTLRQQKSTKVLFSSAIIPEEVIDCVVMGNDSLIKSGGHNAACLICDVFYEVSKKINDQKTSDVVLKSLGEEFSNLNVEDMKIVCKETLFYGDPKSGIELFNKKEFQTVTMPTVIKACQEIGVLDAVKVPPTFGFGDTSKQLNFDKQFMEKIK